MRIFFSSLLIISLLFSCQEDENFKPGYAGSFGELIVVMPDYLWNSTVGDTAYAILGAYQYGFPQDERQFNIIHVKPNKFQSVLKSHRNVCIIKLDSNAVKPMILEKSKWARGQVVVTMSARKMSSLVQIVAENGGRAAEIFKQAELNRHAARNKKFGNKELGKKIQEKRHFEFITHKDAYLEKNNDQFTWIRVERERSKGGFKHQISQGIMLFSKQYEHQDDFLDSNMYRTVNTFLKNNLPGPGEGQYMTLNFRYIEPRGKDVNFRNNYAREYRGLWRMQGNAMGGPMYLLAFLDEVENRIIYAFGYVFAPQFDKREYLREVEGMINSIKIKQIPEVTG